MSRNIKALIFLVILFILASASHSGAATEPSLLGEHGDWKAFIYEEKGEKVCFMSSQPKKEEGKYSKRDPVYIFITHWPAEKTKNVVSYVAGYSYKTGSEVSVEVDGKKFSLFTQGGSAWALDASTDDAITQALRKGSKLVVKGTSARGTATTDTFSLKGSGSAYDAITKACKM